MSVDYCGLPWTCSANRNANIPVNSSMAPQFSSASYKFPPVCSLRLEEEKAAAKPADEVAVTLEISKRPLPHFSGIIFGHEMQRCRSRFAQRPADLPSQCVAIVDALLGIG
ncbi:hypothetical protein GOODEAATRI_002071 [Goodea atripinnis]|uniref:Uncharacterized protein n=1 Tax=Goodea atripinnis TaxID=208336 RepID=A0ABV0N777_9TELE